MPEFHSVQHAQHSPTRCVLCNDFVGPFIDTCVELDLYDRIYICAPNEKRSGCAGTMAALLGWTAPEDTATLTAELEELHARVAQLESEDKIIQLTADDVERYVNRQRNLRYKAERAEKAAKES